MNRILVSQGHERSIGLEVFLKSFLLLEKIQQSKFHLFCFKESLEKTISSLKLNCSYFDNYISLGSSQLKIKFLKNKFGLSESFESIKSAEFEIEEGDILITLPTTKAELFEKTNQYTGHTDYFRKKYNKDHIVMLFVSDNLKMALLTEHISLSEVEKKIDIDLIYKKITTLILGPYKIDRFIFAGVNPHCGESGIISKGDKVLTEAIEKLKLNYPNIKFEGPVSGDTILQDSKRYIGSDCIISPFHDQGLTPFKTISGMRASNITVGLPFVRLSPDHGTAFDLYGKDKSNYFGAFYTIKEALRLLGKNGNR